MLYTTVFMVGAVWIRRREAAESQRHDDARITASDFTLQVSGLPPSTPPHDIKAFFEKLAGASAHCSLRVHLLPLNLTGGDIQGSSTRKQKAWPQYHWCIG